jgi:hypothetical protein
LDAVVAGDVLVVEGGLAYDFERVDARMVHSLRCSRENLAGQLKQCPSSRRFAISSGVRRVKRAPRVGFGRSVGGAGDWLSGDVGAGKAALGVALARGGGGGRVKRAPPGVVPGNALRHSNARASPIASSNVVGHCSSTSTRRGSPSPAVNIAICCGSVTSSQRASSFRNWS